MFIRLRSPHAMRGAGAEARAKRVRRRPAGALPLRICPGPAMVWRHTEDVFLDVFDLTRNPDQIGPAYLFFLLFVVIGVGMSGGMLYLIRSGRRGAWFYLLIALFITGGACWALLHEIRHVDAVKAQVLSGRFASVEGCLDQFHPGLDSSSEADSGTEQWYVAGQLFEYGPDEILLGYHATEPGGGIVHADSWVRVGYVRDEMLARNDIVRLEVRQHACPAAPDYAK